MPITLKDSIIPDCPDEFKELEVLYENSWVSYDECGWIVIFKFFNEIMVEEYQFSVMEVDNTYKFNPTSIDPDYLNELIMQWDTMCNCNEDMLMAQTSL